VPTTISGGGFDPNDLYLNTRTQLHLTKLQEIAARLTTDGYAEKLFREVVQGATPVATARRSPRGSLTARPGPGGNNATPPRGTPAATPRPPGTGAEGPKRVTAPETMERGRRRVTVQYLEEKVRRCVLDPSSDPVAALFRPYAGLVRALLIPP